MTSFAESVDAVALLDWVQYQPQLVTADTVVVDRRDWDQLIGDVAAAAGWVAAVWPPQDEALG